MRKRRQEPLNTAQERVITRAELAAKARQSDMTAVQNAVTAGAAALAGKQDAAPNNGKVYVQKNGQWVELTAAVIAALPVS